jgi:citrate lyase beta subunit/acyl dehydratase
MDPREPSSWRSLLFLPQFAFEKIPTLDADCFIVDLQDAVPLHLKKAARAGILEAHAKGLFTGRNVVVRVNELALERELERDLDAVIGLPDILGIMPAMATGAACIDRVASMCAALEAARGVAVGATRLLTLIETPEGLLRALEIARAGQGRQIALLYGSGDLLRLSGATGRAELTHDFSRNVIVHAARAAEIEPFDTPFVAVADLLGLGFDARAAKVHGFTGKACLHPSQLPIVNRVMAPSFAELRWASEIAAAAKGGELSTLAEHLDEATTPMSQEPRSTDAMAIVGGRVVGPPHIKAAKRLLRRRSVGASSSGDQVIGRVVSHAIDTDSAAGVELPNPYELTVLAGWRDLWTQCFYSHDRTVTSVPFARELGLTEDDRAPVPFLMALYLACCMSSTHGAIFHLGFRNGRQHAPVCVGDTLRQRITMKSVRTTGDGKRAVVSTHRELVRGDGAVVFSLDKLELYGAGQRDFEATADQRAREFDERTESEAFRARAIAAIARARAGGRTLAPQRVHVHAFEAGDLVLHGFARPMGTSANLALSTLFLVTHPIHLDHQRFDHGDGTGIVVSGGLVVALAAAAAARDFHEVLWEELIAANNVSPVAPGETVGALSYVAARAVHEAEGYEELVVKTLGVRNMTPSVDLAGVSLPRDLFRASTHRATNYEALCKKLGVHALEGRVVCEIERRLLRALPVS